MEIVKLPVGQPASVDVDCLRIEEQDDGSFRLTASALCGDAENSESVTLVDGPSFASASEAEDAGIVWAESIGVERLFISCGTTARPLKLTEMDLPL